MKHSPAVDALTDLLTAQETMCYALVRADEAWSPQSKAEASAASEAFKVKKREFVKLLRGLEK